MEKNLQNEEALNKFIELVNEIRICMFITNSRDITDHTRPMATIEVEEDGTLWFYTDKRSIKVDEVQMDHMVHLVYAHPGKESYLDVWGTATLVTDQQTIKDKWSPIVKAWFPDGEVDPNLALLQVKPDETYYWDAEAGKMVQFFKMAVAAVSGNSKIAEGSQGKLNV